MVLTSVFNVRADEIDDYLQAQIAKNHLPGLSVAIVRNGKIIKLKGYGVANLEWEQPVTPDTVFQIASSTKPFTGTALMMLVEEGKISLDDKVSKYLPDAPAAWQNITIRHLATHASGIGGNVDAKPGATAEEFVKAAYRLPLDYQPGEKSAYALSDFIVLTYIIEKVTGQSFNKFLKTRLYDRFGMSGSGFEFAWEYSSVRSASVIKKRATVYKWETDAQKIYWFLYAPRSYSAGGMFSSAADIARFSAAFDEGKVLSNKYLEQMWSRDKLADGSLNPFGVGWIVGAYNGRKTVGHSGGPALGDILRFPEEKLTIVVLSNGQRLYPYLAQGVADFYFPPAPVKQIKGIEDNDAELTRIVEKVLDDGMRDKLDESLFTAEALKDFIPSYRNFGLPFFKSLEPIQSLVLTEHKENENSIVRRYRSVHGKKAVVWTFTFTKDKKIISFNSNQE
jgi:CubicO group peptidase (beta-lactamase class C family)